MDFVALDVETANPDLTSICQIGFAEYRKGWLARSWGYRTSKVQKYWRSET